MSAAQTGPIVTFSSIGGASLSSLPGVLVIHSVQCLPVGLESPCLLLSSLPAELTAPAIGQLFAAHGRLSVNVVLTHQHGLAAVVLFEHVQCARSAHAALHGMTLQLDTRRPATKLSPGEEKQPSDEKMHLTTTKFIVALKYARYPLQVQSVQPVTIRRKPAAAAAAVSDQTPTKGAAS